MKITFLGLLLCLLFLVSCQEDPKVRAIAQQKEAQKREVIFNNINQGWNFNARPMNDSSLKLTNIWAEWRNFLTELAQKPQSSIGAFQQKAKTLSQKADELSNNIPIAYNLPEVKSRIEAIATKMNLIDLYIHLNQIPDKKIVQLVQEANVELVALQQQLAEINQKSQIRMEEGESDMLQMLDTARAIPMNDPNIKPAK